MVNCPKLNWKQNLPNSTFWGWASKPEFKNNPETFTHAFHGWKAQCQSNMLSSSVFTCFLSVMVHYLETRDQVWLAKEVIRGATFIQMKQATTSFSIYMKIFLINLINWWNRDPVWLIQCIIEIRFGWLMRWSLGQPFSRWNKQPQLSQYTWRHEDIPDRLDKVVKQRSGMADTMYYRDQVWLAEDVIIGATFFQMKQATTPIPIYMKILLINLIDWSNTTPWNIHLGKIKNDFEHKTVNV